MAAARAAEARCSSKVWPQGSGSARRRRRRQWASKTSWCLSRDRDAPKTQGVAQFGRRKRRSAETKKTSSPRTHPACNSVPPFYHFFAPKPPQHHDDPRRAPRAPKLPPSSPRSRPSLAVVAARAPHHPPRWSARSRDQRPARTKGRRPPAIRARLSHIRLSPSQHVTTQCSRGPSALSGTADGKCARL